MEAGEVVSRLEEIRDKMLELLEEAMDLIAETDRGAAQQARYYWYAHIKGALTHDHEFLGGSMITMEDTIERLENPEEEEVY